MDVRCERCRTQYELDESRIPESGVTVQCTTCHHIFVVKKKALLVTLPVKPGSEPQAPTVPLKDAPSDTPASPPGLRPLSQPFSTPPPVATATPGQEPPAPSLPPATAASGTREWRVRQSSGNTFTFKDLTTLQRWIVERKVSRDDEISATGETWKRLGDIAELAAFFQVVDEAQKAAVLQAQLGAAPGAASAPRVPQGVQAAPPSPAQPSEAQGRRWPVILVLLLVLLGLGAGGYYYLVMMPRPEDVAQREALARLEEERREKQAQTRATQGSAEAPPPADAGAMAAPLEDGGALAAIPAARDGGTLEDAGTASDAGTGAEVGTALDAGTGAADAGPSPDAGAPGVKRPAPVRDFDYYMSQGNRLRERERPAAALEAYAEAAELEPERVEPYSGRGLAYLDLGSPRQAEAEFKQALKINPNYGEAIIGLAETYRSQGKKAEAIRFYERYLEILPNGPEASVARSAIERLKE